MVQLNIFPGPISISSAYFALLAPIQRTPTTSSIAGHAVPATIRNPLRRTRGLNFFRFLFKFFLFFLLSQLLSTNPNPPIILFPFRPAIFNRAHPPTGRNTVKCAQKIPFAITPLARGPTFIKRTSLALLLNLGPPPSMRTSFLAIFPSIFLRC